MRRLAFLVILVLFACVKAQANDKTMDFWVELRTQHQEVFAGDSCLVSVTLYSTLPFSKADCVKRSKAKGALYVREIPPRQRSQQRVLIDGHVCYALKWTQMVVATNEKKGRVVIPSMKFKGEFIVYDRQPNMIEQFFGQAPESHVVKAETKSKEFVIEVSSRPRRSANEIIREGGRVM